MARAWCCGIMMRYEHQIANHGEFFVRFIFFLTPGGWRGDSGGSGGRGGGGGGGGGRGSGSSLYIQSRRSSAGSPLSSAAAAAIQTATLLPAPSPRPPPGVPDAAAPRHPRANGCARDHVLTTAAAHKVRGRTAPCAAGFPRLHSRAAAPTARGAKDGTRPVGTVTAVPRQGNWFTENDGDQGRGQSSS